MRPDTNNSLCNLAILQKLLNSILLNDYGYKTSKICPIQKKKYQ